MTQYFAPALKDAYKVFHPAAYKPGTQHVHANFTNRFGKHTNVPDSAEVMFIGLQSFIIETLIGTWNETFFGQPKDEAIKEYSRIVNAMLGKEVDVKHMEALHDLGYLPLSIRAVAEGTLVPYAVPSLTIDSTVDGFGWCVNMIETVISAELWGMCTSATTAFAYRKRFEQEELLRAGGMIKFMGHDFSYRGMFGTDAAAKSGFGHLCSFVGSDTIPAALFAEKFYGARIDKELVFASVDATEHSVMCSYGMEGEKESLEHLITKVTPNGIISIVSDTWDFWKLVTEYLPELKKVIMERDGTLVIRPDSGDPVKILCGYNAFDLQANNFTGTYQDIVAMGYDAITIYGDSYALTEQGHAGERLTKAEAKGLIVCLWDTFGGTVVGDYKLLDSHIGAIYGDSITLERQDQIIKQLKAKGFVPSVVLGIGSFTYQYVTRDTHGSAMKATNVVQQGKSIPIFKDPKTDQGKKSAKGILSVIKVAGELILVQDCTLAEQASTSNELKEVFRNGKLLITTTLEEIRARVDANFA